MVQIEFPGEQSSVPEVAATLPTSDDPTLPVMTFRFWFIGTIFLVFSAAVAQFMYFRQVPVQLNNFSVILMTYPMGVFMAKVMPDWRVGFHWPFDFIFARGTFIGGSLNPGPFNIKEHTLIVVAASTNNNAAYATDILTIQRLYYGPSQNPNNVGWAAALLLIWTTQCIGYGFAGLVRDWLVYPAAMWWPSNLVIGNLLHVFHAKANEGLVADRIKLFNKLTTWVVIYEFLPQYFAPYLARVSIFCLMWGSLKGKLGNPILYPPENLANVNNGGGLGFLTFDWQQITAFGPMFTPFWAQMNVIIPIFVSTWIVAPWMYKKNIWSANMYPLTSPGNFDVNGDVYNVSKILNNRTLEVDDGKYANYSQLRLSTYWALLYGSNFAVITAILVHVALFFGKELVDGIRASRTENEDVHIKIMRKYPEVPSTWYLVTLGKIPPFAFSPNFPPVSQWWGILFALSTVVVFIVPIGIVQAISNVQIGTNVITEFIFGLAVPGKAIANVCFKTYGYTSMSQGLALVQDLKLGVYMKIPPKAMFICQMYATIIGGVVNYAVMNELIIHVPDIW
ncbi:OPT oligopeptide transporter protein-domain-containing protein [Blyttiomyces helicus]|uniref:OPT oligopeptide transporter protein-domain-containing protein n=1 Tax=Blyttiomyces helicus TaxID=388810 RepID=A0A4P9W6P7_9FUNG|nr:OPT oligopeptide transporter protein-domain-containing protein [Blyttiomyces helicus]|eukprot:RKO88139.1 OPT oligopeptide transporter protein-domain-containing protein [Blyttiomyces helicus]